MTAATRIKSLGLLAFLLGSTHGFVKTAGGKRTRTNALSYRTEISGAFETPNVSTRVTSPEDWALPTWLSVSRSHLLEENISKLKAAMLDSFFDQSDTDKLIFVIKEASNGDRNKMAGAAEFCFILVDTMEMGFNALVAAVFHYCSCVAARESQGIWRSDPGLHQSLHRYGVHAEEIARDAGNLKKMEMVFSSIIKSPSSSGSGSPDSNDTENLRNLLLAETKDWRALAIRSAACLYRLRGLELAGNKELTPEAVRVSREALYVYAPLASRLGMERLKSELEGAAFKTLYRRQFKAVTSLARGMTRRGMVEDDITHIGQSMKDLLGDVSKEVNEMLRSNAVFSSTTECMDVSARVKEPFSIWKKMLRKGATNILDIPDALALRIVLKAKKLTPDEDDEVTRARERALCYYAQELCKGRWVPLDGNPRFKDYIENPKPNGYQSLHYTASTQFKKKDWNMEIQVRSAEMHKVAEYGLASHWDYKAKKGVASTLSSSDQSSDAYLRSVQEWHWQQRLSNRLDIGTVNSVGPNFLTTDEMESKVRAERIRARTAHLAPFIEAFDHAQSDLSREHVYVFLSQSHAEGNIIALPAGACVLDALREGGKRFGSDWASKRGAVTCSHNGADVNLTKQLRNGDVLTVAMEPTLAAN